MEQIEYISQFDQIALKSNNNNLRYEFTHSLKNNNPNAVIFLLKLKECN